MHIVTLAAPEHYEYLLYVFHKHVKTGLEPDELQIASQVWSLLKGAKELELPSKEDEAEGPEVIRIPGPVSVVHEGDMTLPVGEVK